MSAAFSGYMHWCKIQCKNFLVDPHLLGLPRVLNESGFTVYVAVVLLQTSMQVWLCHFFTYYTCQVISYYSTVQFAQYYCSEILFFYECQIVTFTLIWFIGRFWWCFILWSSCSMAIWLRGNFLKKL